jgi:hypothetical protein
MPFGPQAWPGDHRPRRLLLRPKPWRAEPSGEVNREDDETDNDGDDHNRPYADNGKGDERRGLCLPLRQLTAKPPNFLSRAGGETFHLFADLVVQLEVGVAARGRAHWRFGRIIYSIVGLAP